MNPFRCLVLIAIALCALPSTVGAHGRYHRAPAPIFVATPMRDSPITPYFFPYGGRYRYNSPGPVYDRLYAWSPSCRLWRYNYLYWTC